MICALFGNNTYGALHGILTEKVEQLILFEKYDTFLIGDNRRFDVTAKKVLEELKAKYHIQYYKVSTSAKPQRIQKEVIYPVAADCTSKNLAASLCDRWMIENSDAVLTVGKGYRGAPLIMREAGRMNKRIFVLEMPADAFSSDSVIR